MSKFLLFLVIAAVCLSACSKESSSSSNPGKSSFQAKINGQLIVFNVQSATLLRSTSTNQKRIDILGVSPDGNLRVIMTLGENTATGNSISVKKYTIRLFNEDDPNTSFDESSDSDEGFFTYSTKVSNSWITEVYAENGEVTVTACNAASTTISGTFQGSSVNLNGGDGIIATEGKFDNIKYIIGN